MATFGITTNLLPSSFFLGILLPHPQTGFSRSRSSVLNGSGGGHHWGALLQLPALSPKQVQLATSSTLIPLLVDFY